MSFKFWASHSLDLLGQQLGLQFDLPTHVERQPALRKDDMGYPATPMTNSHFESQSR